MLAKIYCQEKEKGFKIALSVILYLKMLAQCDIDRVAV